MRSELSFAFKTNRLHGHNRNETEDFLTALSDPSRSLLTSRVGVVVAHPDDESVGIAGQLPRLRDSVLIHVTDGAPNDPAFAQAAGFDSRDAYRMERELELDRALDFAGVAPRARIRLGVADQQVAFNLVETTFRLMRLFAAHRFHFVFTHPYEGGHPDHDATAFCVHQACSRLRAEGLPAPVILEMASYFEGDAGGVYQQFIDHPERQEVRIELTDSQRAVKRRMLDSHATQARYLHVFGDGEERFRAAPDYDFALLPNGGVLHYETFSAGMTRDLWPDLVATATASLDETSVAA